MLTQKKPTGGPAFPRGKEETTGLSIRDYFAGQALAGLLANPSTKANDNDAVGAIVAISYEIADVALQTRKNNDPE